MNTEKPANEPCVPCPLELPSPFRAAADAIESNYDELKKTLLRIEDLIARADVEALRQAGEDLLREANSRGSNRDYCRIEDSHFTFTADRRYSYGDARREPKWHTVPFLGAITAEDVAIYLTITGKNKDPLPLKIAQFLVEPQFAWNFWLSEIRERGAVIPSIPGSSIKLPQVRIDERRFLASGWNTNSAVELGPNWRERGKPICDAVREFPGDTLWLRKSTTPDLVRFENKYIWLSLETPSKAAELCPDLIQLKDHFGEIAECLNLWRPSLGTPDASSARLKHWLESKSGAAPWIAHIAEMIVTSFSPWPDPYHLRPENDAAKGWSSEKCLQQVLPLFRALEKAPVRGAHPPNLIKTFLTALQYLIKKPDLAGARVWAGGFSEMWKFSVSTRDHTWINGEILGEPHSTLVSNPPLKFEGIGADYRVSCGGIDCFISEEKNRRY